MAVPPIFIPPLRHLIGKLVSGDLAALVADGSAGEATEEELAEAIRDYGGALVMPPEVGFGPDHAKGYPALAHDGFWSIDMTLWTAEEGPSQLTLRILACAIPPENPSLTIKDIEVL